MENSRCWFYILGLIFVALTIAYDNILLTTLRTHVAHKLKFLMCYIYSKYGGSKHTVWAITVIVCLCCIFRYNLRVSLFMFFDLLIRFLAMALHSEIPVGKLVINISSNQQER